MAYASSIQTVTDANGTVHAFLENDGLLWQCKWNAQAQRWDQAQVVPGAYGGEKLQVLLVEDLWPTSGKDGNQAGNTPGIVLAYRIGSGEAAQVYATLGQWGSDGQLSWSAPLLLGGSGTVTEAIGLRSSGDGSFELISQRRAPGAADPGNTLQTITGARSDSELIWQSFSVSGSEALGYQLNNITTTNPDPSPIGITFSSDAAPVAPASATAGSTEFSRADLLLAPSPAAVLKATSLLSASSEMPGSSGGSVGWSGGTAARFGNPKGQNTGVFGPALGQTSTRWQLQIPNSSPQLDFGLPRNARRSHEPLLPGKNFFELLRDAEKGFAPLKDGQKKLTVGLIGRFGPYGYGTQTIRNDVGLTLIRELKQETGDLRSVIAAAKEAVALIEGIRQKREYTTGLANFQTKYYYKSLNPRSPEFILDKIKDTSSITYGKETQTRERTELGSYLQWSRAASIGVAMQGTIKADSGSSMPNSLRDIGYGAGIAGSVFGLATQAQGIGNYKNIENLTAKRNGNNRYKLGPAEYINKKLANKNTGGDPYEAYQWVQLLQALIGGAVAVTPAINNGFNSSISNVGRRYGFTQRASAGLRYLYKSIAGFYGNIREGFYYYPLQDAYSGRTWQLKFQFDIGAALPFGVSIPVFADQLTFPNPLKAAATTRLTASQTTGNSPIDNYTYLPASGSTLLPTTGDWNGEVPLIDSQSKLQLFTLNTTTDGAGTSANSGLPLVLNNRGSGLTPGTYVGVPILGELLPGSAAASLSFTVGQDGKVDATSVQIQVPTSSDPTITNGQYLFLPETSRDSGIYALIPDVFSTGILQPPADSSNLQDIRDLRTQLPVITARASTTSTLTPQVLTISDIVAVPQVVLVNTSTATGTTSFTNPIPSDNSLRTYKDVPVSLNVGALNTTTASVSLSNGSIVKVVLDDPLYLSSTPSTSLTLTVDLLSDLDFITDYKPTAESSNPVFTVNAQVLGYSNVVEDQSYSANPGAPANSDQSTGSSQQVWLADGINDQWQQTPTQGGWPVFNRVVFGSVDSTSKQWTVNYLNGSQIDSTGVKKPVAELEPDKVTLEYLYNTLGSDGKGPVTTFSAASTPTVISLAGQTGERFANSTAVFWVEASKPVIPVAAKGDGSTSYQDFLNQLYGSQQINYRIKKPNGTWQAPIELYAPVDAVIRHLKAFAVEMDGTIRTLLVWDETSISTIKDTPPDPIAITGWIDDNRLTLTDASSGLRIGDLISGDGVKQGTLVTGIITPFDPLTQKAVYRLSTSQSLGSTFQPVALNATPLLPPTVLKAGFLNPAANTIQWSDLFREGGSSTITTIPWDQTNDIGVGIESLSVASKQVVNASGQVRDTAVLSWSENVRTPYVESVLNDQPLIYLQFADLQPGFNDINIGSTASETTTGTSASSTGLNFTIASALSKSSGSAVQNIDGTGVIATGTGSQNSLYNSLFNSTPINQRPSSPLSQLTGTITGSTLTLTALSGELTVGDLLTGPGLAVDTQITAVLNAFDAAKGTGQYSINTAPLQNITSSTAFEAVPDPAPTSSKDLGLPYSGFSGSINGTTLTVSQLNGSLAVGDLVIGEGITFGTSISAVLNVDASTGLGEYQLSADPLQQGTNLAQSALIATPSSSVPYTIEFWTKLSSGSNPQGAGLVAFGQPSTEAVGPAVAPSGWLMTSTFTVQRITVQQAAAQGFQDAYDTLSSNSAKANDLYAWGWSLDASGANTTALNGNGGSNVYSNALSLTNLYSGQTIDGVTQFLNSYGLQPGDLPGGDGLDASTIDLVPGTSLDFNISLDPDTGLPVSNLNAVSIDTASSLLNSGLVFARDGQLSSDPGKNQSLKDMFQALWDYQETYASSKVAFSLDPAVTGTSTTSGFEQYGGLELTFSVSPGPAISVNQEGQLVFDVADGVAITSDATSPENKRQTALPADLRDDQWHYVVATYLPTYRSYTINGVATQLPTNGGTAKLYVDNQLVASQENVSNAYLATNINDTALLLPSNAGGAIDQFALYNKALLTAPPLPSNPGGLWPEPGRNEALTILKQLGYPATADTPNPGAIDSAISEHWRSRDVNPNNALLATFSSSFTPSSDQPLSGSWSQAAPLNPIPELQATIPSATASSLAQDLVIPIKPTDWSSNIWTNTNGTTNQQFNPGGDILQTITVTLAPDQGGDPVIRVLSPGQVLMGQATTLATLQPRATSANLDYTFLSNAPELNLLISRKPSNTADVGELDKGMIYKAEIKISVCDSNASAGKSQDYTTTIDGFNTYGSQIFNAYKGTASGSPAETLINKRTTALATAAVIEAAPLQLKYIDSGVVLKSASSQLAANSPATPSPAPSFGQSTAYGWFESASSSASSKTYSGWLVVAQPSSANAISDPAGRAWIQYTGDFTSSDPKTAEHKAVTDDAANAPNTWLNALANSNFSPEAPNRPLLNDKTHQNSSGGLLVKADPTLGWGQNFAQTMLVADINGDGVLDLVISAPSANGGGKVVIIDGNWIKVNLNNPDANSTLNLASPDNAGSHVLVLSPAAATSSKEDSSQSAFGWALAFDSTSKTLYIGAPNYSRKVGADAESVPIGAVYQYKSTSIAFGSGNQSLSKPTLGLAGRTDTNDVSGPASSYWGAQLGASLAVSDTGKLAIGAPGVEASLLYSGTEAVNQLEAGNKNPSAPYGQGALIKVMLPTKQTVDEGVDVYVTSDGTDNKALADVISNNTSKKKSDLANEESTYMQALKELQTKPIAKASADNNSAIQTAAVGSVYLFNTASGLTPGPLTPSNASATFYGPNGWNTGGATDFGASLAFGDSTNSNSQNILAVGAPSTGGPGSVYLINTSQHFDQPNNAATWIKDTNLGANGVGQNPNKLGPNQYLAYLTSGLTLYGAEDLDQFGSGLVNLGDTNSDGYEDLLVQAPNASSAAGNGYVVFGNEHLIQSLTTNSGKNFSGGPLLGGHNPAVGSVKPGSIGQLTFADGSPLTTAILSELGHGVSAATGQGSFGAGDVDANGNNDIQLGSGINGQAYLTYGHDYLEAIGSLQLQKLASNTGYLLDGLASQTQGSLRSLGDFNGDGYGDYFSRQPGIFTDTVRIELGANTQDILASYAYNDYTFQVASNTEVIPVADVNGDGFSDIALFLQTNLSRPDQGNAGAGSTTGLLYGRASTILPLGAGFGYLAPVSDGDASKGLTGPTSNPQLINTPLTVLPGLNPSGGLSDVDPSFLAVGNRIYCVVKGYNNNSIYFNQSSDGGNTWAKYWTNLTDANTSFKSWNSPSLAWHQDKLYLAYLDPSNQLTIANWDPNGGDPSVWSNPTTVGDGKTVFVSRFRPQLLSDSSGLSISWVGLDGTDAGNGSLQSSISTNPDGLWEPVTSGGASPFNPAMVRDGDKVYMARLASDNTLYWTQSTDAGQSWADWQQLPTGPTGMYSEDAPSLAIVNGALFLTYLGKGNQFINITKLKDLTRNEWENQVYLNNQTAKQSYGAVAIGEFVNGTTGLAIYYVANDTTGTIYRTFSATPLTTSTYSSAMKLGTQDYAPGYSASGALAATTFNGATYLAYPGGTPSAPSTTAYIASSAGNDPGTTTNWNNIASRDTGNTFGIGLSSNSTGLLLNSTDTATNQQATYILPGASGDFSFYGSRPSVSTSTTQKTASILAVPASGSSQEVLLEAVANTSRANTVSVSTNAPLWLPQQQLLERSDNSGSSFQAITATAAPTATLLNGLPVLAVNNGGTINVYTGAGGRTFTLNSSFSPGDANAAGTTSAGLTTTATGLGLSYRNTDGSVSLQRLNFLQLDGTPVNGVVINADGSIDTSKANLQWEGINLASSSGVSTSLATTPLNVNGSLLLGSVSNSTGELDQVQLHAVPALSDPASTTWLNSTVQLPDGNGGWWAQQQADPSTSSTLTAVGDITGDGLNDMLVTTNNVVLAASPLLKTGVRLIRGASTSVAFLDANKADASTQTLQLAAAVPNSSIASTALTSGSPSGRLPQLSISAQSSSLITRITSQSDQTLGSFTATTSNPNSLTKFFETAAQSQQALGPASSQGQLALNTSGSYGDLNGDGRLDFLAADTPTTLYGVNQQSWALWSIRAAGDVNGNGVDDVMLALRPLGPAYGNGSAKPYALQTVLLDGSLFPVDKTNNTFRLDQLRSSLNPYNPSEINDTTATSSNIEIPLLQSWLQPLLSYESGDVDSMNVSTDQQVNPAGALSQSAPSPVLDSYGKVQMFFSGVVANANNSYDIWSAVQDDSVVGGWKQFQLKTSTESPIKSDNTSPSAAYYKGQLYVAYCDQSNQIWISHPDDPQADPRDPGTTWISYQIKSSDGTSTTIETTHYKTPTLLAEEGRLALFFPSNNNVGSNSKDKYEVRYLYSSNPDTESPQWGSSLNDAGSAYKGVSGILKDQDGNSFLSRSPISAVTFQGRTVLAFMSDVNYIVLATAQETEESSLLASKSGSKKFYSYSYFANNWLLNNISLATDQARLYAYGEAYTADALYSFKPNSSVGQYSGAGLFYSNSYGYGSSSIKQSLIPLYMQDGVLMASGVGSSNKVEIAPVVVQATEPSQPSLAGYSVDGNIDVNGDGFMDMLVSDPSDSSKSVNNQYALFGGDFLNIASQVGTPGDDVMIGTPLADVIYTLQGADQVNSNGGKDVIYTGAGDDSISIKDYAFIRIDAGAGFNSLQLEGNADQRYNFAVTGSDAPLWAPVANGGSSNQSPALVRNGNTIYMARCGLDSYLYWTQSTDGGQSWADWQQLPKGITSNNAPSLAIAGGDLYLAYVGLNQSVHVTQFNGTNQWNDEPVILYQDIQYSPPTATKVKNGSGQLAAIAETVNGAEGLAIYYVDATSGNIFRQYNNDDLSNPDSLSNPYYWEVADLFPAYGPLALALTKFDGSTYMAQMDNKSLYTHIFSPGSKDPAISSNWNYIAAKNIGNSSGISLSSIPKAVGETSSGLLLNTTDIASNQQFTSLLADAIPNSSFQPFSSRPSASAAANQQTASILAIPAKANSQRVLLEAVADASRADIVSVSIYNSINPDPGIFSGTQLKNIQLINSIDYGANTLVFNAAAVNAINPDRVLFLTPDGLDFISLSDEFSRNQSFDTSSGGSLWYAYTAGPAVSSTSNPTLVYVRVPEGQIASTWLSNQVSVASPVFGVQNSALIATTRAAGESESVASNSVPAESFSSPDAVSPSPSQVAGSTIFGDGLTITAYRTTPGSGVARFRISRTDVSRSQVISYVSTSSNSSAEPGSHYTPAAGLVRLDVGQAQVDITVPIYADAIAALRKATVSLEVAELIDRGQKEFNLLLEPEINSEESRPVLSGLELQIDPDDSTGDTISIGFRADTNKPAKLASLSTALKLKVVSRENADDSLSASTVRSQIFSIGDGISNFDLDVKSNDQVELELQVNTKKAIIKLLAKAGKKSFDLNNLNSSASGSVDVDITYNSTDTVLTASAPNNVTLSDIAIDFNVAANSDGNASVYFELPKIAGDLALVDQNGKPIANQHVLLYVVDKIGSLVPFNYD
uniref:hypothetical protein n=1 Tax=Synechococcus sp. UW140 TaxID=368503 RepID=UPI003137C4B1